MCFHPILAPSKAHKIGKIFHRIQFRDHFFDFYRLIFSIWMQAETDFRYQRIEKSAVSGEFCVTSRPFVYKYAIFVYAANHAKRITKQRFCVRFYTFMTLLWLFEPIFYLKRTWKLSLKDRLPSVSLIHNPWEWRWLWVLCNPWTPPPLSPFPIRGISCEAICRYQRMAVSSPTLRERNMWVHVRFGNRDFQISMSGMMM